MSKKKLFGQIWCNNYTSSRIKVSVINYYSVPRHVFLFCREKWHFQCWRWQVLLQKKVGCFRETLYLHTSAKLNLITAEETGCTCTSSKTKHPAESKSLESLGLRKSIWIASIDSYNPPLRGTIMLEQEKVVALHWKRISNCPWSCTNCE